MNMKKLTLLLVLLLFALPAHALTGKVLVIVCDKLLNQNAQAYMANNRFSKAHEVQGWDYETVMFSDTAFINSLYATDPVVGGVGSRYGDYDMAVILNMPNPYYFQSDANCESQGMYNFNHMINRNSVRAFPIPLLVPFGGQGFQYYGTSLAAAYTGIVSSATLTSGKGEPYKDAQGDSLYLYTTTGLYETLVANSDSTTPTNFSWVKPLVWRYTAGREAVKTRYATMWMTVGAGNHRVIWLPYADQDRNTGNWLTAFAMFTKVQPVEIPVVAYAFGPSALGASEVGTDTVQYGAGFKRNVDYAVANGIKLDLACYPYYMATDPNGVNAQAITYQTNYPGNIRLTVSSMYGWSPGADDLISSGSYSQKLSRIKYVMDPTATHFPTIDRTRLDVYGSWFSTTPDSSLMAIVHSGITDVYNWGTAVSAQYPAGALYSILGPRRIFVNDAGTLRELRIHSAAHVARYDMEELGSADWIKTAYVDTVGTDQNSSTVRRAKTMALYLNYSIGNYRFIGGAVTSNINSTATIANRVNNEGDFAAGMFLPALTFSGGSKLSWAGSTKTSRRAKVDSTQSTFLNTMKQLNAQKKMGDYIVATYGTTGQNPLIWAWLDEVKWDRKNNRSFANEHVDR
jgi:hypothetical protein